MLKVSRIFLVGPMGTGKTSIGSRLSRTLGCSFVDTDAEIETRTGVKIDVIFNLLSEKNQLLISLVGTLIFIIPTSLFIIFISMDMVIQSWSLLEGSSEAGGLDLVFLLKTIIPMTGFLIFLQSISDLINYLDSYKL